MPLPFLLLGLFALPASVSAAPHSSYARDTAILSSGTPEEVLRHFGKRQVDTPQGAAIILTLIVVGMVALVIGLTWAYLRGGHGLRMFARLNHSVLTPNRHRIFIFWPDFLAAMS